MSEKIKPNRPEAVFSGANRNIFNLMGIASRALKEANMGDQAREMLDKVKKSHSYQKALSIMGEYVNIV